MSDDGFNLSLSEQLMRYRELYAEARRFTDLTITPDEEAVYFRIARQFGKVISPPERDGR